MLLGKETTHVLTGMVILHAILLLLVNTADVTGIFWKIGEEISFPFALSRYWDLLILPAVFCFTAWISASRWWNCDIWDYDDDNLSTIGTCIAWSTGFAIIFSVINLVIVSCQCSGDSTPHVLVIFSLLKGLGILSILYFSALIMTLKDTPASFFFVGLVWFATGTLLALFTGIAYFILLSIPASIVMASIVFWEGGELKKLINDSKTRKTFLRIKRDWQNKWIERREMKKFISTALNLKATTLAKQKIRLAVSEIRTLQKQVKQSKKLAGEIRSKLNETTEDLVVAKNATKKEKIDAVCAGSCAKLAEVLAEEKAQLAELFEKYSGAVKEKENRLKELLDFLARANTESDFYKETAELSEKTQKRQKEIKELLKKLSENLK